MTETERGEQRKTAIHLLRSGVPPPAVAHQLACSISWVYKWQSRFAAEGWAGLGSRSRVPKQCPRQLAAGVRQSIRQARSELEAEAADGSGLQYIGAGAVRARLAEKEVHPLPSTASIERVLRAAGMTRPRPEPGAVKVIYPHIHPVEPHQLCQVDIVPHFLTGGQAIACFNAIDVVSRYPTGQAYPHRRSQEAAEFLVHVWQEVGLPQYTQVDNEGCFSGGFTHPGVLGKVVRLALSVGTQLVFSPLDHPQSNGSVERFHQDYDHHVWDDTDLRDCADVQRHADTFFPAYRRSCHQRALHGDSPTQVHQRLPGRKLSPTFSLPPDKLPLTEGRVHFMRLVSPARTVSVLNMTWPVPEAQPHQGVWVTLELKANGANLRVYDQAPDAQPRTCLAQHPFPLKEPVQLLRPEFQPTPTSNLLADLITGTILRLDQVFAFFSTMF